MADVEETVEVDRAGLVDVLGQLVLSTDPNFHLQAYMDGLALLLDLSEESGLAVMGELYSHEGGDEWVAKVAEVMEVDPSLVVDHSACAGGCERNVMRREEYAYMARSATWLAAGDPEGFGVSIVSRGC